jgi:predicted ATP-binding protein involved in virulence
MSSGEKSLLILVSDLARRLALATPLSNDPLKEGQGIVLIDEIDLHLHPRWQRKVIGKLQEIFPKIQWVVTTHSPLVISNYDTTPNQILILTEEEDTRKKVVISLEDLQLKNSGAEPNRILKDIMQVSIRDERALADMDKLASLLNPRDHKNSETMNLFDKLYSRLGSDDIFIKKAQHQLKILNR